MKEIEHTITELEVMLISETGDKFKVDMKVDTQKRVLSVLYNLYNQKPPLIVMESIPIEKAESKTCKCDPGLRGRTVDIDYHQICDRCGKYVLEEDIPSTEIKEGLLDRAKEKGIDNMYFLKQLISNGQVRTAKGRSVDDLQTLINQVEISLKELYVFTASNLSKEQDALDFTEWENDVKEMVDQISKLSKYNSNHDKLLDNFGDIGNIVKRFKEKHP